jgi:RES domain-containing protein
MRVWRLTRAVHASDPLSGRGAAVAGNRWNSPGTRVAYTATSRALAALEMLVHVTRETVPLDMVFVPVDVPDALVREAIGLPRDWADLPWGPNARRFGDRWVAEGRSLGLLGPSVIVPAERNLLINPRHRAFGRVRIGRAEPFAFDRRLPTLRGA